MQVSRKYEIITFLFIAFIAASLRVYHLGYYSLWMDEVYQVSLQAKAKNILEVIKFATYQSQPPLDYFIGYLILKFIPFSEYVVRFPAFIFGTSAVLVSFIVTKKIFNFWCAAVSSTVLSFSTVLIYYSQEARPYSIFFFFLMILFLVFFFTLDGNGEKVRRWILFTIIACLLLLTRGMAPVTALFALNAAFLLAFLVSFLDNKRSIYPYTPFVVRNLLSSTFLAGLFYLPFFLYIWKNSLNYVDESLGSGERSWELLEPLKLLITDRLPGNLDNYTYICLIGFILATIYIFKYRKTKPYVFIFLLYALLEPLISVYLFYFVVDTNVLKPKYGYFSQSIIPIFIVASYGYYFFFKEIFTVLSLKNTSYSYILPVCIILVISVPKLPEYYSRPKADYRGAVEYLRTIYRNEDIAVYDTFRKHDAWEPHLYGKHVYYGNTNTINIRQFKWQEWALMLEKGFTTDGRLFLFLQAGKEGGPPFTRNNALEERNFEQMTIIFAKDKSLSLTETSLLFINELLDFFPDNSSKVDLYLAKARLTCQVSASEAQEYIEKANALLADNERITFHCSDPLLVNH